MSGAPDWQQQEVIRMLKEGILTCKELNLTEEMCKELTGHRTELSLPRTTPGLIKPVTASSPQKPNTSNDDCKQTEAKEKATALEPLPPPKPDNKKNTSGLSRYKRIRLVTDKYAIWTTKTKGYGSPITDPTLLSQAQVGSKRRSLSIVNSKGRRSKTTRYISSYGRFTVRDASIDSLTEIYKEIKARGGILPSSGSYRGLTAKVSANRSASSLHYLGGAIDIFQFGGMINPYVDPFIVVLEDPKERLWRVFQRCPGGTEKTLIAYTSNQGINTGFPPPEKFEVGVGYKVTAKVIDITAIFHKNGWSRIPTKSRAKFGRRGGRIHGASEWWHFQDHNTYIPKKTSFNDELIRAAGERARDTEPFKVNKNKFFNGRYSFTFKGR